MIFFSVPPPTRIPLPQKKFAHNRKDEKEWIALRDSAGAGKDPWERVTDLLTDKDPKAKAGKEFLGERAPPLSGGAPER